MSASTKTDLILKYAVVIYEYFHIMQMSEIMSTLENQHTVIQIGMQSITHIYKLSFFLSKQISTAVCHSQKGMYCYLEYIEQMNKTNMLHNLDNTDAVVFIYNKTLTEIYGQNPSTNMMTNILSISENDNYKGTDFIKTLEIMSRLANTLLWFNNETLTTHCRMELVEAHLHPLSALFVEYSLDIMFPFFEFVQTKLEPMKKEEYITFLQSLTKQIKRAGKHRQIPTKQTVADACFYLQSQHRGKTVSQIGEEEGWKHPMDELVKIIF
jgi:hypothetical protein